MNLYRLANDLGRRLVPGCPLSDLGKGHRTFACRIGPIDRFEPQHNRHRSAILANQYPLDQFEHPSSQSVDALPHPAKHSRRLQCLDQMLGTLGLDPVDRPQFFGERLESLGRPGVQPARQPGRVLVVLVVLVVKQLSFLVRDDHELVSPEQLPAGSEGGQLRIVFGVERFDRLVKPQLSGRPDRNHRRRGRQQKPFRPMSQHVGQHALEPTSTG